MLNDREIARLVYDALRRRGIVVVVTYQDTEGDAPGERRLCNQQGMRIEEFQDWLAEALEES